MTISDQAQKALTEEDSTEAGKLSERLNSAMNSSRHAHDLIVRMLAYQALGKDKPQSTDLSEAAKHTTALLQQSIATGLNVRYSIEPDLHAAESDVVELQKLLIQMFQYLCDAIKIEAASGQKVEQQVLAELKVNDYLDQSCACCYQKIDGQYLELALSSGQHAGNSTKPLLHLANELADDPSLRARINALHEQLAGYDGHLMLHGSDKQSHNWRLLLPVAGADGVGIRLDNSVQLEKYRARRRSKT
ncbi:MAG: hypothetical protein AB8B86_14910 [Pseudomonadales bacterium]